MAPEIVIIGSPQLANTSALFMFRYVFIFRVLMIMASVECVEVTFESSEYKRALEIRYEELRKPLGLEYNPETLKKEHNCIHIVALVNNQIVGTLILEPISKLVCKMKQVAVLSEWQKTGVGKNMVAFSEKLATKYGFEEIQLNARVVAVPFYTKLNFLTVGEEFLEVNIPHLAMYKKLKSF